MRNSVIERFIAIMIFHFTKKTAICDSIEKHVKYIPNCQYFLQACSGARIENLDYFILTGSASVNFDIVLISCRYKCVNTCKLVDFGYFYNRLISNNRKLAKSSTKVIYSAIIPRPTDKGPSWP